MKSYELDTNKEVNVSSQSFSGTDKSTSGNIGVVYPLDCNDIVKDVLNVSSIIDHHDLDKNILVKRTEARVVTADVEKKIVDYVETRCVAVEYDTTEQPFEGLIEIPPVTYRSDDKIMPRLQAHIMEVVFILSSPDMDERPALLIDEKNIERKSYTSTGLTRTIWNGDELLPGFDYKEPLLQGFTDTQLKIMDEFTDMFTAYLISLDEKDLKEIERRCDDYYVSLNQAIILNRNFYGDECGLFRKEFSVYFKDAEFRAELAHRLAFLAEEFITV